MFPFFRLLAFGLNQPNVAGGTCNPPGSILKNYCKLYNLGRNKQVNHNSDLTFFLNKITFLDYYKKILIIIDGGGGQFFAENRGKGIRETREKPEKS